MTIRSIEFLGGLAAGMGSVYAAALALSFFVSPSPLSYALFSALGTFVFYFSYKWLGGGYGE